MLIKEAKSETTIRPSLKVEVKIKEFSITLEFQRTGELEFRSFRVPEKRRNK